MAIGKASKTSLISTSTSTSGSSVNFKSKTTGAPAKIGKGVEKTSSDVAAGPKKKKKKRTPEEKLIRAEKKAKRLQGQMVTEKELLESLPQVAPDSQEKRHLDEYLHMFRRLQRLIRKCEAQCLEEGKRADQRDLYALCTLYSQQREVIADIRSVSDMSGQVATMESTVIRPIISSIGQNVLDTMFQIKKVIMDSAKPDKVQAALLAIEQITNEQGKFLQHQYNFGTEKVSSILLG